MRAARGGASHTMRVQRAKDAQRGMRPPARLVQMCRRRQSNTQQSAAASGARPLIKHEACRSALIGSSRGAKRSDSKRNLWLLSLTLVVRMYAGPSRSAAAAAGTGAARAALQRGGARAMLGAASGGREVDIIPALCAALRLIIMPGSFVLRQPRRRPWRWRRRRRAVVALKAAIPMLPCTCLRPSVDALSSLLKLMIEVVSAGMT